MDIWKVLLHVFNVVLMLAGLVMVSIGIWSAVDKIYVAYIVGNTLFSTASYMTIAVGFFTLLVSVLGIYAVAKENLVLIMLYFGCLVCAAILMLVAGILAVVFKTEIEGKMVDEMRKALINGYGGDMDVTDAWDKVQAEMRCCAISETLMSGGSSYHIGVYVDGESPTPEEAPYQDSWPIYRRTEWFRRQNDQPKDSKKYVPKSCCVYESGNYKSLQYCQNFVSGPPTTYVGMLTNDFLYYNGCYAKAKTLMMDHADIFVALGFVFAFIMIGGIVVTVLVARRIYLDRDEAAKRRREPDNL